jgi:hypothetical protein
MTMSEAMNHRKRIEAWVLDRLGTECLMDREERAKRLFEEAAELLQAEDVSFVHAVNILRRVYDRPKGEPEQEMGGVMVCAHAWAVAADQNLVVLTEREVARIESVPAEVTRAKHAANAKAGTAIEAKPPDGVLPPNCDRTAACARPDCIKFGAFHTGPCETATMTLLTSRGTSP